MLPGFGFTQGKVPRLMVVSVCPKPSYICRPVSSWKRSATLGFIASPAVVQYSRLLRSYFEKSSRIMKRYMVGGAQNDVTWYLAICCMMAAALNFSWSYTKTVAPANH